MAKFIFKIMCWTLCVIVFIHIPLLFSHDEFYSSSHLKNIDQSIRKLDSIPGRRIVLLGGSNVGFSINSEEIEDAFHLPVINTGTHASLGMRAQLLLYDKYFHKNDIVIFCPEYEQFELSYFFGQDILIQQLANTTQKRCSLSFLQVIYLCDDYLVYIKNLALNRYKEVPEDNVYSIKTLNQYGDAVLHKKMKPKSFAALQDLTHFSVYPVKFLKKYADSLRMRQVQFILLPPVLRDVDFNLNVNYINKLKISLGEFNIPFYSIPQRYKLDSSCFFDTRYHCVQKGSDIRTNLLIEDVSQFVNK